MKLMHFILFISLSFQTNAWSFEKLNKWITFDYTYVYNTRKRFQDPLSNPVKSEFLDVCHSIIASEIMKYPNSILNQVLDDVVVLHRINFSDSNNNPYGMALNKRIFIRCGGKGDPAIFENKLNIIKTLHHELSSLLLNADLGFDIEDFVNLNQHGRHSYLSPTNYLIFNSKSSIKYSFYDIDTRYLNLGFLTPYSFTGAVNDFNMIAEYLMVTPEVMQQFTSKPYVGQKIQRVYEFYLKIGIDLPYLTF